MKEINYEAALNDLIESLCIRYRGCLIERNQEGYLWREFWSTSLDSVKEKIDSVFPILGNSIKPATHD